MRYWSFSFVGPNAPKILHVFDDVLLLLSREAGKILVLNNLAVLIEDGITQNGGCPLLRRLFFLSFLWHWNTQVPSRRTESSGLRQTVDRTGIADSLQYISIVQVSVASTPTPILRVILKWEPLGCSTG